MKNFNVVGLTGKSCTLLPQLQPTLYAYKITDLQELLLIAIRSSCTQYIIEREYGVSCHVLLTKCIRHQTEKSICSCSFRKGKVRFLR